MKDNKIKWNTGNYDEENKSYLKVVSSIYPGSNWVITVWYKYSCQ